MFGFAVKRPIAPATESMTEKTPEIRDDSQLCLSKSCRQATIIGAIHGLVTSMAKVRRLRGDSKEVIIEKINPFVASCVASGDLDRDEAEWILGTDWYMTDPFPSQVPAYASSVSLYPYFHDVLEETKVSRLWATDFGHRYAADVDPQEKAVLDAFRKAEEAYRDAAEVRDKFFRKRGASVLYDVIKKYTDHLNAIDEEFLTSITKWVVETLNDLEKDNSCPSDPNIKNELAVVNQPLNLTDQGESDS